MKLLNLIITACIGSTSLATSTHGAVLLDSFTEGAFSLKFSGPTSQRDTLSGVLLDHRFGLGAGVKDWGAILNTTDGNLSYSVNLRGAPNGDNWFGLSYTSSQGLFSLAGVDGFSVNITNMVGEGELLVFFGSNPEDSVSVPTVTGQLRYPLSNITTYGSLDDLYRLEFRFIAKTADFSITLDEITLVPEPSTVALAGIAAAGLLRRRRRA